VEVTTSIIRTDEQRVHPAVSVKRTAREVQRILRRDPRPLQGAAEELPVALLTGPFNGPKADF
jgi:hypothetical protein